MNKRAQVQLSFGMIFSIIIIAVTMGVAGYIIYKFINTGDTIKCKIYDSDIQKKIDNMWSSDVTLRDVFSGEVPSKTKKVCFGNINQTYLTSEDEKIQKEMNFYVDKKSNIFFYPKNSCGEENFKFVLNHAKFDKFFCVDVASSKAGVKLSIGDYDNLVIISK